MSFQSKILTAEDVVIHDSHAMEFQPCLFLECGKCFLSVKNNADELRHECAEDIHEINNRRIAS